MSAAETPFFHAIHSLRTGGELVLSLKALHTTKAEDQLVVDFLDAEYANETLDYPHQPPLFDAAAALWAARIVYFAAQLFIYREDTQKDLPELFKPYLTQTAAAALSADLCLRFLSTLVTHLTAQEPTDPLLPYLHSILTSFPYSAIGAGLDPTPEIPEPCWSEACFRQLYADRVIARRDASQLQHLLIREAVSEAFGNHAEAYWSGFQTLLPEATHS